MFLVAIGGPLQYGHAGDGFSSSSSPLACSSEPVEYGHDEGGLLHMPHTVLNKIWNTTHINKYFTCLWQRIA